MYLLLLLLGCWLLGRWVAARANNGGTPAAGSVGVVGCLMMLWALIAGCGGVQHPPKPQPALKARSLLSVKGLSIFPVANVDLTKKKIFKDPQQLAASLSAGMSDLITSANPINIQATGNAFPTLDLLKMDLTGGVLGDGNKTPKWNPNTELDRGVHADKFEIVATPLTYHDAKFNISITADQVDLNLLREKNKQPCLALTDAVNGRLSFDVTQNDLARLLKNEANASAGKYGISVEKITLNLTSNDDRSLSADLVLTARQLLLTAQIHMVGQIDVNDKLEAKISNLSVHGEGVVGSIVCGIVGPGFAKNNGRVIPLKAFPSGNVQLTDFRVKLDDSLHVTGKFGNIDSEEK